MSNQFIRSYRGGPILDDVSLAGATLHGTGAPDVPPASLIPEVDQASNWTVYVDDSNGFAYQKRNGVWPNIPYLVYGAGTGGGITNLVSLGSGESILGVPPVSGISGQLKSLTSTGGTVVISNNGTSLDLEVTGTSGGVPNNYTAIVAPTVIDATPSYEIGSRWVDTVANKSYTCVDASVGAAIWKQTSENVQTFAGVPDENSDLTQNFNVGDVWINQGGGDTYICRDNTTAAAKWALYAADEQELKWDIVKQALPTSDNRYTYRMKVDGTSDQVKSDYNVSGDPKPYPDSSFDRAAGWDFGSQYIDDIDAFLWTCTDPDIPTWDCSMGAGEEFIDSVGPTYDTEAFFTYNLQLNTGDAKDGISDAIYIGSNYASNRPPLVSDGISRGYNLSSWWFDQVAKKLYTFDTSINDWHVVSEPFAPSSDAYCRREFNSGTDGGTSSYVDTGTIAGQWRVLTLKGANPNTWTPETGDNASVFINGSLPTQAMSIKYIGAMPVMLTVTFFVRLLTLPSNNFLFGAWKDTVGNPAPGLTSTQIIQQSQKYMPNNTQFFETTFNVYVQPNDYIGPMFNSADAPGWTHPIDIVSCNITTN